MYTYTQSICVYIGILIREELVHYDLQYLFISTILSACLGINYSNKCIP